MCLCPTFLFHLWPVPLRHTLTKQLKNVQKAAVIKVTDAAPDTL